MDNWFNSWFNADYLKLYANRNDDEAAKHVEFLFKALHLKGNESLLDIGCGTGRHALAFAERGLNVAGVDLSKTLIAAANAKLEKESFSNVQFIESDMFDLKDLGTYDIVTNLFTSFGYFESDEQNAKVFHVAKTHLNTKGKFFLDYLHPFQVLENLVKSEEQVIDGQVVKISRAIEGDRVIKTIEFPEKTYFEKVKLYTREQIEKMLQAEGFTVIEVWNDYQGNPWRPTGDRQLFYCKLT